MALRIHTIFFSILCLFCFYAKGHGQYTLQHYTTKDGLPHDFTFQIYQDADDFLWIGTDDGLTRFDGNEFRVFNNQSGFKNNYIIDSKSYKNGLVLAVWKGGLHFLQENTITVPRIEAKTITNLGKIHTDGTYILGSDKSAHYAYSPCSENLLDLERKKFFIKYDSTANTYVTTQEIGEHVYAMSKTVDSSTYFFRGNFPLHTNRGIKGIHKYSFENSTIQDVFPFLREYEISDLVKINSRIYRGSSSDKLIYFTQDSIIKIDDPLPNSYPLQYHMSSSTLEVLVVHNSEKHKDIVYSKKPEENLWNPIPETEKGDFLVSALYKDRAQNIWISTNANGLYKIAPVRTHVVSHLLENKHIEDITINSEDTVFLLAQKEILAKKKDQEEFMIQSLSTNGVGFVSQFQKSDTLRIITADKGEEQLFYQYHILPSYYKRRSYKNREYLHSKNAIKDITSNERIWVAMTDSVPDIINDIIILDRLMYVATSQGVFQLEYKNDKWQKKENYKLVPGTDIHQLEIDRKRNLWIVSTQGLYSYNLISKKLHNYSNAIILNNKRINHLYIDHRDDVWIATQRTYALLRNNTIYSFETTNNQGSSFFTKIIEDSSHQLYIAGNRGVLQIDNTQVYQPASKPRLLVRQKQNQFQVATVDFSDSPIFLQYQKDKRSPWINLRSDYLTYSELGMGTFKIRFRTRNARSNWTYSTVFHVSLTPPWYRNKVILLCLFSLFCGGAIISIYARLRQSKRKNQIYLQAISKSNKLEKELATVRENVARDFHDELGNKLAGITVLSQRLLQEKQFADTTVEPMLQQIQKDSDSLYYGIKDFIWSIDSRSDILQELIIYLSDFGEELFAPHTIVFRTTIDLPPLVRNQYLPFYWSRHLLLLFKEAMTNTLKHSKATIANLQFGYNSDQQQLRITFRDDGVGFDKIEGRMSNGLRNMRKRAELVGGQLKVHHNNGICIEFTASLPVNYKIQYLKPPKIGERDINDSV